jgi:hypothetical protein
MAVDEYHVITNYQDRCIDEKVADPGGVNSPYWLLCSRERISPPQMSKWQLAAKTRWRTLARCDRTLDTVCGPRRVYDFDATNSRERLWDACGKKRNENAREDRQTRLWQPNPTLATFDLAGTAWLQPS